MTKTGIILDSNYFLHFHSPESINWIEIIGERCSIVLMVIPPVSSELDRKKWDGKSENERNRAREVISKFKTWFHDGNLPTLSEGVNLEKLKPIPLNVGSSSNQSPDDQILEYAINQKSHYDRILVLTHDFGLQDRLKDQSIEYIELPDIYMRKSELDPVKKELIETQKELNKFKNRIPKIKIQFSDNQLNKKISMPESFIHLSDEEISKKTSEIMEQFPLYDFAKITAKNDRGILVNGKTLFEVDKEKWTKYNSELSDFYSRFKAYLYKFDDYNSILSRLVKIDVKIENCGFAPATEVYINLHFPVADNVEAFDEDNIPSEPKQPSPPSRPNDVFSIIANINAMNSWKDNSLSYLLNDINPNRPLPNVTGLSIKKTRSFDVDFKIKSLKHHTSEDADSIYLLFPSTDEAKSFQIKWKAISDEMPEHDQGTLSVIIEK